MKYCLAALIIASLMGTACVNSTNGKLAYGRWHRALITTYSVNEPGSSHTAQGCVERGLRNSDVTFAARSYQVPCGGRAQFCYHKRCVVATRTDTAGGGVKSDSLDLNRGLALALKLPRSVVVSADGSYPGGYASVAWRRVRG